MTKELCIELSIGQKEPKIFLYSITLEKDSNWVNLTCNGEQIAKLVDEQEARRLIWTYWNNVGIKLDYIESEDFTVVHDT